MTAVSGYFAMDQPGAAHGVGEVPLRTLLAKGEGDLRGLFAADGVRATVIKFIPKYPSAFDSNKLLVQGFYATWPKRGCDTPGEYTQKTMWEYFVMEVGMVDPFIVGQAQGIVERVLARGINHGNEMELRWAAAQGPWPAHIDEQRLLAATRGAYYVLFDTVKRAVRGASNLDHAAKLRLVENIATDLQTTLSKAWDGINGFRH